MDSNLPQEMPGRSKKVIRTACVLLVVVILLVGLNTLFNKSPKTAKNMRQADSIFKEYDVLGFSFTYPRGWSLTESTLQKGTTSQQVLPYFSVSAADGNMTLLNLAKDPDWHIIIEAQKEFSKDSCEVMAASAWKDGFPSGLQKLKIMGADALRVTVEKGTLPDIFGPQVEPYSIPIKFTLHPGDDSKSLDFSTYPNAVRNCFQDSKKSLRLTISYHSNTLTKDSIVKGAIDTKIFEEMDKIITSIQSIQ